VVLNLILDGNYILTGYKIIMATLDEVYRKFGETAEAAQLLETELSTILFTIRGAEEELFFGDKPELAKEILTKIDKSTLGQLLRQLGDKIETKDQLENLFSLALKERNRLTHSFYRQHNFRRNTEEGRDIMIRDLDKIHDVILKAYKAALLISGIDIDSIIKNA
jgi:hypothetical protein